MHYYSDFNVQQKELKEDVNPKETHRKEWFSLNNFSSAIDEYCREGSLHGLKYLRNPELTRIERLFWLVIFSSSVYFSVVMTWDSYVYMINNQVEMTYNPISTPIWDIPFPGVMICSANPVRKSIFNLEDPTNRTDLMYFSKLLCPKKESFGTKVYNMTYGEDFFRFVHQSAIPCNQLFKRCSWNDKKRDCCSLFKPVVSKSGQCFVFNEYPGRLLYRNFTPAIGAEDNFLEHVQYWHIATGYPSRSGNLWKTVLPLWSEHMGEQYGLTVTLNDVKEEHQKKCSGGESVITVHVFSPLETGESGSEVKLTNGLNTRISLYPSLTISRDSLRSAPLAQRGCLFQDEGHLKYFKGWSQSNCMLECLITNVLNRCNCVPFDLRRIMYAFNYSYCTDGQLPCLFETLEMMSLLHERVGGFSPCECLPLCSTLYFEFQTRSQPIVTSKTKPSWAKGYNKSQETDTAQVAVFYSQSEFSAYSRVNTASFTNFMAVAGGLLGLFLGFSFLSGFEILYFAIVKPTVKVVIFYCKRDKVTTSTY